MLGKLFTFFVIFIALVVGLHQSFESGAMLKFFDDHPSPAWVPMTEYVIGQTLYIFHDLDRATTWFAHVADGYPDTRYADDAAWARIQCLDDLGTGGRAALIEQYEKYLERFPNGNHATVARSRADSYKSGAR